MVVSYHTHYYVNKNMFSNTVKFIIVLLLTSSAGKALAQTSLIWLNILSDLNQKV